jgi:hypothetical protein
MDRESETVELSGAEKVTFAVSEGTMAILRDLSVRSGKPIGEVLRDSIALEKWLTDLRDENARVIVEKDGHRREFLSV